MPPCKKFYLKTCKAHNRVIILMRQKAERNLNGLGFSLLIQIQFVVLEFKALDLSL